MSLDLLAERIRLATVTTDTSLPADFLASKNDSAGRLVLQCNGFGAAADGPYIGLGHARGAVAAPANAGDGDNMGDFEWYAYAGGWQQSAEIRSFVTGAVANGVTPSSNMTFKVTTGGALTTRVQLFSTGRFGIGSASRATEADSVANGAGALWVAENAARPQICFHHSASNVNAAQIMGRKSRGASLSAPTNVVAGDSVAEFRASAYSGAWFDLGYMEWAVDAAVVNNQAPATNFGLFVNLNNASALQAMKVLSDRRFIFGTSMTQFVDAAFNYNLSGGANQVAATWGQNGGSPNSMIFGYSTYSTGYTNGHPVRMTVIDQSFSCGVLWENKKQGAASNALVPAFLIDSGVNAAKIAFFSSAPTYGNGEGVMYIANRTTAPTANPTGGGILYAEGGALKWRGSGGTTTTIANA